VNSEVILRTFADRRVEAILIGGMNFLLRHQPVLTYDVDFWVRDTPDNLLRTVEALRALGAKWGRDEKSWGPIPAGTEWLQGQSIFCLTTDHGAVDIFREVRGLEGQFEACWERAAHGQTAKRTSFRGLSDRDMLACQLALPEGEQNANRVAYLQAKLKSQP
jgi:hypothetical protein